MTGAIGDLPHPAVPAGAYDDLLARVLPQARAHRPWEPGDGPLPALFVSHGAPPTLDDPRWPDDLFTWAQAMPKPRAIDHYVPPLLTLGAATTPGAPASTVINRLWAATPSARSRSPDPTRDLSDTSWSRRGG